MKRFLKLWAVGEIAWITYRIGQKQVLKEMRRPFNPWGFGDG